VLLQLWALAQLQPVEVVLLPQACLIASDQGQRLPWLLAMG